MFLPHRSSWKVFTGNELAALLGWWMFFNWRETHPHPQDSQKVHMLATTVSSKILQAFARTEGFHFEVRRMRMMMMMMMTMMMLMMLMMMMMVEVVVMNST